MKKLKFLLLPFVLMSLTSCSAVEEYKAKKAEEEATALMVDFTSNINDILDFYDELYESMEKVDGFSMFVFDESKMTFADLAEDSDLTVDELIEGAVYYQFEIEKEGSFATASDTEKEEMRNYVEKNFFGEYEEDAQLSPEMVIVNCAYKANGKFDEIDAKIKNANTAYRKVNSEHFNTEVCQEHFESASNILYNLRLYHSRVKDPIDDYVLKLYEPYMNNFVDTFDDIEDEFGN